MATVNKNFKVKNGLVVEGSTATVAGNDILTKSEGSDQYIIDLIGGETLITSVDAADFTVTGGELNIAAGSDIARDADITSAINALTTSDIEEGTNQYFTNQRALDATSAAYDSAGSASTVAGNLTTHENDTTAHGATGAVVGTTNTQSLSNKTISYVDNTITVQVANVSDLTASASELNTLDGITASTAELNLLDGVTATTTELNYVDGVTSAIQTQLNDKAPLASPELTGTPLAPTATPGTNSTQIATTAYADAAVAALVDGAPELLNTLNELAAALDDNPDVISDLQGIAAGKQDTLTAGSNIDITGTTISVTGLDSADISDFNTAALSATSAAYDVAGAAAQALSDAEDYADALTTADIAEDAALGGLYFTNQRALDATASAYDATGTAQGIVDALDTDDIEEGATNEYFTDARARNSAADLLTGATLSNITITGTGAGLTITAENGVAGSTTSDLTEGTNLYFTNERAQDAVGEAVGTGLTYTDSTGAISVTPNTYDAYGSASAVAGDLTTHTGATEAHGATGAVVGTTNTQTLTNKTLTSPVVSGLTLSDGSIVLEGTTANDHETTLTVTDPTADRTITLPDATGTVALTGNKLDAFAATTSAELAGVISDETGTGALVFADTPTLVTPIIGEATGTSLELSSNDLNVGSQSVGLRTSDGYTNPVAVFSIDADDDYAQLAIKNTGNGVNSSTDFIAYANNGDDTSGWIDLGITSSAFNDQDFTITAENDGYIFMEAPSGTTGNGDLVIATGSNGAENRIVFAAGGLQSNNTQMTITPDESVRIVIPTASTSPTTGALVVDGGVGIQGDVNIQGTITFGGSGTTVTTDNLAVQEPVIYLADGNTTDNVDTGIIAQYNNSGTKYAGIVRDATDGVFKLFANATTKPTSTVNFAEAGLEYGDLKADAVEAASGTFTSINIAGVVDETEIGYLNGVTSSVQTQLDAKLPKSGGTMSGAIAMGTNAITGMANPTNAQDAATKAYVDGEITSVNNAVGALDTDDITEGSALYFTDQRAIDALQDTTPNFTAIEIDSLAKQIAATTGVVATASTVTAYSFAKADYRSAKFLIKTAYGTHTELTEVLLTLDSLDNIAITEYATVGTNGSSMTVTADVDGSNVRLRVTTTNNNSTVTVMGTLVA